MEWQLVVAIIAAVLGSTGVAGTLTGGFQLTRRARLRRAVEKSTAVLTCLAVESEARSSLSRAIDRDTLQLSALTLVSFPGDLRRLFRLMLALSGIYFGVVAVIVGYSPSPPVSPAAPMTTKIALGWLVGVLGLIFSMAMGLNALIRNRRERFVELILSGTKPADALVELGERSAAVQILDLISSAPFTMLDWIGSVTIRAITAVVRRRMHAPTADLTRDEA